MKNGFFGVQLLLICAVVFVSAFNYLGLGPSNEITYLERFHNFMQAGPSKPSLFSVTFDKDYILEERWPMKKSGDSNWWVSSGASWIWENGISRTLAGNLDPSNPWVAKYIAANARDTSNGLRPQNIFRLVLKQKFQNASQEIYARMTYYEKSESPYREGSNGILLFNHYQDEFSLYYAGLRVDGEVVIKKKLNGVYTTLASKKVLDGTYNRDTNPNLIPLNTWIGIKSDISTDAKGNVVIKLYTDIGKTGNWTLALETTDTGIGGKAITAAGYGGLRTDFMDVQFDDYRMNPR